MPEELEVSFDDDLPSPNGETFENAKPVAARRRKTDPRDLEPARPIAEPTRSFMPAGYIGRMLPHSIEAEESLLSSCLLDGEDIVRRCEEAKISGESFYDTKHAIIYETILDLYKRKLPIETFVVAEELKKSRQLDAVGGYAFMMQVSGRSPTNAQANYFINKVREQAALRKLIREATEIVENAYQFTGDIDAFLSDAKHRIDEADRSARPIERHRRRKATEFSLVSKLDQSVLLGNRYLNRGDIAVLSSTSGMGKSSMALQMAVLWALGWPAFGVDPNGPLTSLVIQSEDSDGDVAEVMASIRHVLKLDDAQWALVGQRVHIITDRVNRGAKFIASLRRHIDELKPDLVWINPLQAFMDGDITESKDIGKFLREGLNSLNEPPTFAYMLVHHTTKPSKDPKAAAAGAGPKWSEVMYDMAGGAEIINAARAIMSLRATATEGHFNLILAKRGRRAGAVRRVESQASIRLEPTTTIPLKHATGFFDGPDGKLPVVFWESRPEDVPEDGKARGGRMASNNFADYRSVFPLKTSPGLPPMQLLRVLDQERPIKKSSLFDALKRWEEEGHIERVPQPGGATTKWRRTTLAGESN